MTDTQVNPPPRPPVVLPCRSVGAWNRRLYALLVEYAALVAVLGGITLFFAIRERDFLTLDRFRAIVIPDLSTFVVIVGMTYVLMIGAIDLSVGSVMALSGAVIGILFEKYHLPLSVALAGGVATGLLCGLFNGLVTIRWNLPSFIVTLGMLQMARGATHWLTNSQKPELLFSGIDMFSRPAVFGLPVALFVVVLIIIAGQVALSFTVFGRYITAIGANEEAARLSGVSVRPLKVWVFVLSSLLATMASILYLSRHQFADPNMGRDLELQVIAAVVVGGTSLMGGRGTVAGSVLGLLIILVLGAGLTAGGVNDNAKRWVTGFVIVAAGILDYYRRRLMLRRAAA